MGAQGHFKGHFQPRGLNIAVGTLLGSVSQVSQLITLNSCLFFLFSLSFIDRGLEILAHELCLTGAEVLPLLPAPGAGVLFRSLCPCPVLQQGWVQAN